MAALPAPEAAEDLPRGPVEGVVVPRLATIRTRARRRRHEVVVVVVSVDNADEVVAARGWETLASVVETLVWRGTSLAEADLLGTTERGLTLAVAAPADEVEDATRRLAHVLDDLVDTPGGPLWASLRVAAHRCRAGERSAECVSAARAALTAGRPSGALRWSSPAPGTTREGELVTDLALALLGDLEQVGLAYQPVVDLGTSLPVGAEALVRWTHPRLGPVPALTVVHLAESHGLIARLGRAVLARSLATASGSELPPGFRLHVNVSPFELREPGYVDGVLGALDEHGLPPSLLLLELTETALMADEGEIRPVLEELCQAGIGIGIDDFGTGYSSIARLMDLPAHTVKLDRSLSRDIATSPEAFDLLGSVLRMLRTTQRRVVAEGIESAVQVAHLRALGCLLGQGYALGRPGDWPLDSSPDSSSGSSPDSSQPRKASRLAVGSPRRRRHSHSLRIEDAKPSSKIVLNDSSA
jgi:EAL domain-containing protein (putative c-di-GMP-specific phosphodiesterase class I)